MGEKKMDAVDKIMEQWRNARPDLDCSPMENIGRLRRCSDLLGRELEATFSSFGMSALLPMVPDEVRMLIQVEAIKQ